jgi:hypothetical protein
MKSDEGEDPGGRSQAETHVADDPLTTHSGQNERGRAIGEDVVDDGDGVVTMDVGPPGTFGQTTVTRSNGDAPSEDPTASASSTQGPQPLIVQRRDGRWQVVSSLKAAEALMTTQEMARLMAEATDEMKTGQPEKQNRKRMKTTAAPLSVKQLRAQTIAENEPLVSHFSMQMNAVVTVTQHAPRTAAKVSTNSRTTDDT